jgi:hypothetical protein
MSRKQEIPNINSGHYIQRRNTLVIKHTLIMLTDTIVKCTRELFNFYTNVCVSF